jgi:hypothetical protein
MDFVITQALESFKTLGPRGKAHLSKAITDWARDMKTRNPALTSEFDKVQTSVIGNYDAINRKVTDVHKNIKDVTAKDWPAIQKMMADPVEKAKELVTADFTVIEQKAMQALTSMGFTPQTAAMIMAQVQKGNQFTPGAPGAPTPAPTWGNPGALVPPGLQGPTGNATGGRIAGSGRGDNVPVAPGALAAPGELIVNQHTERRVNQLLQGRTTLGKLVGGESRPHGFAEGGRVLPEHFSSTHDTGGLPGFPAIDVFGPPGENIYSPESGMLVYPHMINWDSSKRVGGGTVYLQGAESAQTYFLTHFASVPRGGPIQAGGLIGQIAAVPNGWWDSHIHEGVHQGIYNPDTGATTLGTVRMPDAPKGAGPVLPRDWSGLSIEDVMAPGGKLTGDAGKMADTANVLMSAALTSAVNKVVATDFTGMGERRERREQGGRFTGPVKGR